MIPDKDLTDDVLDEIIAGAKTSMEQYLALSLKAEREAWRQAGNSPVIPDSSSIMLTRWLAFGRGMQNAGCQLPHNLIAETEAMLAAAPQSPGSEPATSPGKWIPVSERMPENDGAYLCWDNRYVTTYAFIFGAWQANQFVAKNITHWMPLPAAPQEVKSES